MANPAPTTLFAPAERADAPTVRRQAALFADQAFAQQFADALIEPVLVLNRQRQIVFANHRFAELLGSADPAGLFGLRPGEAVRCIHRDRGTCGCGTSEFCRTCGAVEAVLVSQAAAADGEGGEGGEGSRAIVRECRIPRDPPDDALDLMVRATPIARDGELFTLLAITDISHQKRRRILERVFFHDVLNAAMGLRMTAERLVRGGGGPDGEVAARLHQAARQIAEEIAAQRDLMSAEDGELPVRPLRLDPQQLVEEVCAMYGQQAELAGCCLRPAPSAAGTTLVSDPLILSRVLGNMIKNAVEAAGPGEAVTVAWRPADGGVAFSVHNPGFIPHDVQLQVFQRSFSTKGSDRGLGTYGMKLLAESYLGGQVTFASTPEAGTTFTAWIPAGPGA